MSEDIARLVATINDSPDPSHGDLTPSVHALVRLGLPALPSVLPLLESEDKWTRLRAQRVLERTTRAWVREQSPARSGSREADYDVDAVVAGQRRLRLGGARGGARRRACALAELAGGSDTGLTRV